ncbi:hypothetical protein EDC30_11922 [Paucimonas lemoignei]|uniref:Uncharacterized protein n=1 Tax=Paucimonas lemoignei TaxID=29443 RepID=A0A4R3HQV2_PAULE|nr:hypothetical protein [Paucimonas lemoignei]TCS32911.1 hypothetical protein EDC30_11922 [Paucimonas lemoignei]
MRKKTLFDFHIRTYMAALDGLEALRGDDQVVSVDPGLREARERLIDRVKLALYSLSHRTPAHLAEAAAGVFVEAPRFKLDWQLEDLRELPAYKLSTPEFAVGTLGLGAAIVGGLVVSPVTAVAAGVAAAGLFAGYKQIRRLLRRRENKARNRRLRDLPARAAHFAAVLEINIKYVTPGLVEAIMKARETAMAEQKQRMLASFPAEAAAPTPAIPPSNQGASKQLGFSLGGGGGATGTWRDFMPHITFNLTGGRRRSRAFSWGGRSRGGSDCSGAVSRQSDDYAFGWINPASGLPMLAGAMIDIAGNAFGYTFDAIGDLAGSVCDFAGDFVASIADGVSDFGSGLGDFDNF